MGGAPLGFGVQARMRPRCRTPQALAIAAIVALAALGGCGEPAVGGSGLLAAVEGGGAGDHLTLAGTPYEMGWWHGHLLRDPIRALHEEWQRRAFALDGDLTSAATQARRQAALSLVDPVLAKHLPEAVRQELQGLSDACGLPVRTLLLTEMLTDILRFTEDPARVLLGNDQWGPAVEGARLVPLGPWAELLADRWLWVTRRGADGPAVTVLTWPGGLGGVLAVRADGALLLAPEVPPLPGREGLAGVPFRISVRLAGALGGPPATRLGALARTTGHLVLAADLALGVGVRQLVASTGDDPRDAAPHETPTGGADAPAWRLMHDAWMSARRSAPLVFRVWRAGPDTWVGWARGEQAEQRLRVP